MTQARRKALLRLKVAGPRVGSGAISVPDLLKICEAAQSAVNRQAEAMEGQRSLRPGPVISTVRRECTLELIGINKGSATLRFGLAKPQLPLPALAAFGTDVVAKVAEIVASLARKSPKKEIVDAGVLDSLNGMGEVFDSGSISKIEWTVPKRNGHRAIRAVYNPTVRQRVAERMRPHARRLETIEGTLEMADFKETDQKCRIHPLLGYPIICTFDRSKEDAVYAALRKTVRLAEEATINPHSGRIESINIHELQPIEPLTQGAGAFFTGRSIQELATMQEVKPLETVGTLAGGWPAEDGLDEVLQEIYRDREL